MRSFKTYCNFLTLWGYSARLFSAKNTPLPIVSYLILTRNCNISCRICFFKKHLKRELTSSKDQKELSLENWISIIRAIPRYSILSLSGGEPMCHCNFSGIFTAATDHGIVSLETNAHYINILEAEFLLKKAFNLITLKGLYEVSVSFFGDDEDTHDRITGEPGSFVKAVSGVEHLIQARRRGWFPRIAIRTVILPDNIAILDKIALLVKKMKADELVLSIHNSGSGVMDFTGSTSLSSQSFPEPIEEGILYHSFSRVLKSKSVPVSINPPLSIKELAALYQGKWNPSLYDCLFPWTRIIISPFGDVGICPYKWVGNIQELRLKQAWNNFQSENFRRHLIQSAQLQPACAGCCTRINRFGRQNVGALLHD